ncbi:hypothetical protein HDE_06706 [Halotydeus destructor]|nr:hypothetical protein HDE_06706 [Halotydeus destructor]
MADREFEGEAVLITGSASGIGKSTADLFASKGANLILCDLNETGLKQVSDEIVRQTWCSDIYLGRRLDEWRRFGTAGSRWRRQVWKTGCAGQ